MNKKILVEVESDGKLIVVQKFSETKYEVLVDNVVRHPDCTAEDAIRALGTYLAGKNLTNLP